MLRPIFSPYPTHNILVGKAVFVEIDHHYALRLESKYRFDEAGANAAGPADDADFAAADFAGECIAVGLDVGLEHGGRAAKYTS